MRVGGTRVGVAVAVAAVVGVAVGASRPPLIEHATASVAIATKTRGDEQRGLTIGTTQELV